MVYKAIWRKSSLAAPEMSFTTKKKTVKKRWEVNKIKLKLFRRSTEEGAKNNYENIDNTN